MALAIICLASILSWKLGVIWQRWLKPLKTTPTDPNPSNSDHSSQPLTSHTSQSSLKLKIFILLVILTIFRGIIWIIAIIYMSGLLVKTRQWSNFIIEILKISLITDLSSI